MAEKVTPMLVDMGGLQGPAQMFAVGSRAKLQEELIDADRFAEVEVMIVENGRYSTALTSLNVSRIIQLAEDMSREQFMADTAPMLGGGKGGGGVPALPGAVN